MESTLARIENINDLLKMLKAKDKLKRKYDELRFSKKPVDYRIVFNLKTELDFMDQLITNYIKFDDNISEIKCVKDVIIKADRQEVDIPVSIDNLSDCELIFNGFVASHGCIDIYYDYVNDMIKAKNKAKPSKMRKPMIEHMCKINTNICFYPGNYLIKAGDTIGIAIEKQKTKTLH